MEPLRILLLDVSHVTLETTVDMLEYPIGLLYVGTALKEAYGDRIDLRVESYEYKNGGIERVREMLEEWSPDVLGLRSLTMGRRPLHEIAQLARHECAIPLVVAGGPHASDNPVWLSWGVAEYVRMTGDHTILDEVAPYAYSEFPFAKLPRNKQGWGHLYHRTTRSDTGPIRIVPPPGRIVKVNYEYGYVIIDRGRKDNIRPNLELTVSRERAYIGQLVVSRVYKDYAVAEILPNQAGGLVISGDTATFLPDPIKEGLPDRLRTRVR